MLGDQKKDGDDVSASALRLAGLYAKKEQVEAARKLAAQQALYQVNQLLQGKKIQTANHNIAICEKQLSNLREKLESVQKCEPSAIQTALFTKLRSEIDWWENRLASDQAKLKTAQDGLVAVDTQYANEGIPIEGSRSSLK